MRVDISVVQERYAKMSNEELIRYATLDAKGLTPAAQQVIAYEVDKRNLHPGIFDAVEAQNRDHSEEEIYAYCETLQGLDCPLCRKTVPLNGTFSRQVKAIIFSGHTSDTYTVACPDCLDKTSKTALHKSLLQGWWSPVGIFRTLSAIFIYLRHSKHHHDEAPSPALRQFARLHVGPLTAYRGDRRRLQSIITQ
ncbi:hypothetical protein GA0116948_11585 [Chitinophaga costaii]|uniref:Uncharacterized protein n=1 Tax=Chitinophaga costaii TaxID=1335309 RepID=A0A1C4FMN3_9BACT|nr:hypothetical protein [Chitinophaga costaii]PUZ29939.1 hypothetical protein DCM91_00185 [Chitinophaga costaii]SCC57126.1 hypothetical protein GA0116948_11585 [Chitinophaga costaii]